MSTPKKVIFILSLVLFVGISVFLSFNTVVRPTYEFEELTDVGGSDVDGWAFIGFNGNQNTEVVNIDFVRDENGENPDKSKPIAAVDSFTFVSDEYVKYIYISDTVQYIDEQAFVYCKQLRGVYVDDNNPWYTDVDGILYTKDMKTMLLYPICRCTQIVYDDIEAAGEVTNIGLDIKETINASGENHDALYLDFKNKASDDISRVLFDEMLERGVMAPYIGTYYIVKENTGTSITVEKAWSCDEVYSIPEGVERIAKNCFYKCDRLQRIDIPSTVKEIGNMAFFKCYGISLVTLPDGLVSIGSDAFSYCENMKYAIFIPESVEKIDHHAFYQCDRLERFYVEDASEETITLGGNWQPKSENAFKADPAIFGASYADFESYNNERIAEEEPPVVEEPVTPEAPAEQQASAPSKPTNLIDKIKAWFEDFNVDGTNYFVMAILIVFIFIPGMIYVVLEVIRKMFKEDFLMSKKKKEKLIKKREEAERLRCEYFEQLEKEKQEQEGGND
ncbi:MAG: leucine-rich repeat domain-containing protein [Clostridia bacterium]|nr:leucine-rich repeat domain-containing protein [Clostridia bacterium]